ncbi:heme-degrading domain-containing protein [Salinibacillus xinjiangensis]|nr:hypothetical protein [Salinibacillus xinjiangensis]
MWNLLVVDVAIGKAYTSVAFKASSDDVAKRVENLPMFVNAITTVTQGKFTPQKVEYLYY